MAMPHVVDVRKLSDFVLFYFTLKSSTWNISVAPPFIASPAPWSP
jgi:hypothetical protein